MVKTFFRGQLWLAALFLVCSFSNTRAMAQLSTSTISGTVKDSSGGVISGVQVTVTNTETGFTRSGATASDGTYKFPALPVGAYEVKAEHPGFQREVQSGLKLAVGQEAVINLSLQVGAVEQTVAVTAEAPLVETNSANVSGLVNQGEVRDLPLNARNLLELAVLFPGITIAVEAGANSTKGFATKLAISGTRYNANLFQIDGQDINDNGGSAGSATGIMMGAETIREFSVIINGYSAEYGKHTGGGFNAVTKSGTNALHGSAFEFLRNNKLDARNFFDAEVPPFKRNQFGFSLGGPIIKDRTFFFGSYEGLRQRLGLTAIRTVPNADARLGRVRNPATGAVQTFVVNPKVQPFLNSYPLPNGLDLGNSTGQFTQVIGLPQNEDYVTVRVDHQLTANDSLFGRYTFDKGNRLADTSFNTGSYGFTKAHYAAVSGTHLFSPQVINVALFGFKHSFLGDEPLPIKGFTYPIQNFTGNPRGVGAITVTGLDLWGGDASSPADANLDNYQVSDNLFYTKSRHGLKFGFEYDRMAFTRTSASQGAGAYTFNSLANFVQGTATRLRAIYPASVPIVNTNQSLFGLYAQDDLKLSPKLTLNLGLRYEFVTTVNVAHDRVSNLRRPFVPNQTRADLTLGNPMYENPSLKNFAPRVGFAWDPTGSGRTSIRGGFGIFYDQILPGSQPTAFTNTPPFGGSFTLNGAAFPDVYATLTAASLASQTPDIELFEFKPKQPTVYKYSLEIQREIAHNTSVEAGLSVTRGVHLVRLLNLNNPLAQDVNGRLFIPSTARLLQPGFGRVRYRMVDDTSDYDGFRFQVNQRTSHGFTARLGYAFSKSIDEGSNYTGSSDWGNSPGQSRYLALKERGLAAFDIRHALTVNFTYDIPGAKMTGAAGKVLGGWQLSGLLTAQSGPPFTITSGYMPNWFTAGFVGGYPDLKPGAKVRYDTRNPNRNFDPSAFALAPNGIIGNLARNFGQAPGIGKLDIVLAKNTRLFERLNLQFRSEFFNLLNRANFGLPAGAVFDSSGTGAFDPNVGRITGTTTISRQIQFGLRLEF